MGIGQLEGGEEGVEGALVPLDAAVEGVVEEARGIAQAAQLLGHGPEDEAAAPVDDARVLQLYPPADLLELVLAKDAPPALAAEEPAQEEDEPGDEPEFLGPGRRGGAHAVRSAAGPGIAAPPRRAWQLLMRSRRSPRSSPESSATRLSKELAAIVHLTTIGVLP